MAYLTKYVTKDIGATYGDPEEMTPTQAAHIERLHAHTSVLPCSPRCANWLRYGVQPKNAGPHLVPGRCDAKAHDRHHLGLGGRRVLVSREWSGKTLTEHAADRADIVRAVLAEGGIEAPERDRCSATTPGADGRPRYVRTRVEHADQDALTHGQAINAAIRERVRWREEYEQAKNRAGPQPAATANRSAVQGEDAA